VNFELLDDLRPGEGYDGALIFGGDGSVHRQLPALCHAGLPALVVASGSGNDFARELGLSTLARARHAWRRFLAGERNVRQVDLGVIRPLSGHPEAEHYFCCVASIGFDAEASRRANLMPAWLRSHGGYVLAALQEMSSYRFPKMTISTTPVVSESGLGTCQLATLVAIANARSYGGGMKIAPHAVLDDGLLDICFVRQTSRLRMLRFFPTVFSGRHLELAEVEHCRAISVRVETEPIMDVYADGEYICRTPVEISVAAKALQVITG
jgi:diacylglycerol kinase (ATP)